MSISVNYQYIPEHKTYEEKRKQDIISYAGRLLEIVDCRTLIIGVDNNDKPFVYQVPGRMLDALDIDLEE